MGNGRHAERAGTETEQRPAGTVQATSPKLPAALPDGHDGNLVRCPPSAWCTGTSLDAYISELVDDAPPLTAEQRDTLALLLRRPRRR
jgi:glycogen debranching enzyme